MSKSTSNGKTELGEWVGTAGDALNAASAFCALVPGAHAAAAVGAMLGTGSSAVRGYFDRRQARQQDRAERLRLEVMEHRLKAVEEQIEVNEQQVDLTIHVFRKALEDDEDAKEVYYGAIVEMILCGETDAQTIKVLVSAVQGLAKIELDEFVHCSRKSGTRYILLLTRLSQDGAPRKRDYKYKAVLAQRLVSVALVDETQEARSESSNMDKAEVKLIQSHVPTAYGNRFLFAVKREEPEVRPPCPFRVRQMRIRSRQ